MTLRKQLLFVSLLTLVLPWAGCQFLRETESALRSSQQQMLATTAQAIADAISQYSVEFPIPAASAHRVADQLYGHRQLTDPAIDGYMDDWSIDEESLHEIDTANGSVHFALAVNDQFAYLFVKVHDREVVYADASSFEPDVRHSHTDRVVLISSNPPFPEERFVFTAEAPGPLMAYAGTEPDRTVRAYWQDVPAGYQLEARIPRSQLGTHLGLLVVNTDNRNSPGTRTANYAASKPARFVAASSDLTTIATGLAKEGMRLIVTDASGWRLAGVGSLDEQRRADISGWAKMAYEALVERGPDAAYAEPEPRGREQQAYIVNALHGRPAAEWFRGADRGRAIVAVSQPVLASNATIGAVVLQTSTDAILSLTNEGLARLIDVTMIAMLVVGVVLLGYASWLSRRIRRLSIAADNALSGDKLNAGLPSGDAGDEIGDLSRSFSNVLQQLGDYNEYLRTLASKLSHELNTPLAIISSSLENLEHEDLTVASAGYTQRARAGTERLRRILRAMSEANRVEELINDLEPEIFDLVASLAPSIDAYRDVYDQRRFEFESRGDDLEVRGSPELLIQMLDKLVSNAVSFSNDGDEIGISVAGEEDSLRIAVRNPGPPLPEKMRAQLFDSMVSVRSGADDKHLGLGLYVAKIIVDGHNGRIEADNIDGGVQFSVFLPRVTRR